MADNMDVRTATGEIVTVGSKEIAGVKIQRMAVTVGGAGVAEDLQLGQADADSSLPVVIAADQTVKTDQVTAAYKVKVAFTRPADTVAYSAKDVVGGLRTFANIGPAGGSIMITGAALEIDIAAVISGMTSWRLHLYSAAPGTPLADNVAFDLPSADRGIYLGFIELGTLEDLGSTLYVDVSNVNKQVKLSSADLSAYLVTTGGFTPGSADGIAITLYSQAV